jgi:hypothetical protein
MFGRASLLDSGAERRDEARFVSTDKFHGDAL